MNKIFLSLIHREQNKLIILLLSIFMILSFPQCIAMNSIPEQTGEYRIDSDDAIELLKDLLFKKNIECKKEEIKQTINQTIEQNNKNKNQINTNEEMLYRVIQYLLHENKEKKILDLNDFLFLFDFVLEQINNNESINIITEIIKNKDFLEYYKKDLSFAKLIKENLKKHNLDNQEFLFIKSLLDDRYKEHLKNIILDQNNQKISSSKDFMMQVLSSEENINVYADAIGELYSNESDQIIKYIAEIAPFLLYYYIESSNNKKDRFKIILDCLSPNDEVPEKLFFEKNEGVFDNKDIINLMIRYINVVAPNAEELINLIFFIEDKINDDRWNVLTQVEDKIKNIQDSGAILEFLQELRYQNKKFSIELYDLDDEGDIKNQYIEAFKKQENKLDRMKYLAIKDIEKKTKNIEDEVELIEKNYNNQLYNLEDNYRKWKKQLCKEKNDELDILINNKGEILSQLSKIGRCLKRMTLSSIKSQEDNLKEKIINEILGVSISCDDKEIKKIEIEPTTVIIIEPKEEFEEIERNQFQGLQEKYKKEVENCIGNKNKIEKKEYAEIDKSLKAIINDFDEKITALCNKKKENLKVEYLEKIKKLEEEIQNKKIKNDLEIKLQYDEQLTKIERKEESLKIKEALEKDLNSEMLFAICSELEILNTLMSATRIYGLCDGQLTQERYLNLFKIVNYNNTLDKNDEKDYEIFKNIIEKILNKSEFHGKIIGKNYRKICGILANWYPGLCDNLILQQAVIKKIIEATSNKEDMVKILKEILHKNTSVDIFLKEFYLCQQIYNFHFKIDLSNIIVQNENNENLGESFLSLNPVRIDLTLLKLFNECSQNFKKNKENFKKIMNIFCELIIQLKEINNQLLWEDLFNQVEEEELECSKKIILRQYFLFTIYNTLKTEADKKEFIDYILSQKTIVQDYIEINKNNEKIEEWKNKYIEMLEEFLEIEYKKKDIDDYIRDVFDFKEGSRKGFIDNAITVVEAKKEETELERLFNLKKTNRQSNYVKQGEFDGVFTKEEIESLGVNDIYIDEDRYIKFCSNEAQYITTVQIQDLNVNIWKCLEINHLSKDQIEALSDKQMESLPDEQIKGMLNDKIDSPINKFSASQLIALGLNRIEIHKKNLFQELTLDQIKFLEDAIKEISSEVCRKSLREKSLNESQVLHLLKPTYYKILFPLSFLSGSALIINNVNQISHVLFKNNTNNRICSISKFFKNNKKSINYIFGAIAAVSIAHLCKTRYDNWEIINKFLKKKEALT